MDSLSQAPAQLEENLKTIVIAVFDDSAQQREQGLVSSTACKQLIMETVNRFSGYPPEIVKSVGEFLLEKSKYKLMSYEEPVTATCHALAQIFENEMNYIKAADVLTKIPLDGQK